MTWRPFFKNRLNAHNTSPFDGNEESRLSYLTGLLTMIPGEHIPLLYSSCPVSKPVAEAFVIVLARFNPATADPIRRCVSSPSFVLVGPPFKNL